MFRKFTSVMALVAVCGFASVGKSQVEEASATEPAQVQGQLASYSRDYASGITGTTAGYSTMQTPHAMAYGQTWGGAASNRDCSRFYHYPYVFYPQNFQGEEHYKSSDSMYYRYRPEMQIPVYNRHWHNYYPSNRRYHWGHHFILDVF